LVPVPPEAQQAWVQVQAVVSVRRVQLLASLLLVAERPEREPAE